MQNALSISLCKSGLFVRFFVVPSLRFNLKDDEIPINKVCTKVCHLRKKEL